MPSRRLDRSFAVVKVADFEGLTVYVENQPVGRTDREGRVLLDGLRAYERNEISLDPRELPMDAAISLPRRACRVNSPPHTINAVATTQGRKFGPTPA